MRSVSNKKYQARRKIRNKIIDAINSLEKAFLTVHHANALSKWLWSISKNLGNLLASIATTVTIDRKSDARAGGQDRFIASPDISQRRGASSPRLCPVGKVSVEKRMGSYG